MPSPSTTQARSLSLRDDLSEREGGPGRITLRSGSCRTADEIRAGRLHSKTRPDPDDWNAACSVRWRDNLGRLVVCDHPSHQGRIVCTECGIDLDPNEIEDVDEFSHCVDYEACDFRIKERIEANPRTQRYREWEAAAAEARRESAAEAARRRPDRENDDGSPRRPRGPGRPTKGVCQHCGEPTKGGKFVAGHDAKLKGILLRAGIDGDVDAVTEIKLRGWYKPSNRGKFSDEVEEASDAQVQAVATDEFLAERSAARAADPPPDGA